MSFVSRELSPLQAVVAAVLDRDGVLIEANAGFRQIAGLPVGGSDARLWRFFVEPALGTLMHAEADADGQVYDGPLTIGKAGDLFTLRGRVWRGDDDTLRLVAEHDVEELQRHATRMIELNRDYASAQFALAQAILELQQRQAEIVALTITDSLTGVGNHRRFEQQLTAEIAQFEHTGAPLCALMADLDHFKQINDRFGHDMGDRVLTAFGALLQDRLRPSDTASRIGGEEFVVLLPATTLDQAVTIAERLRCGLASYRIFDMPRAVTASFGVAQIEYGEDRGSLMRRVDRALYAAKRAGRNCVVAAQPALPRAEMSLMMGSR